MPLIWVNYRARAATMPTRRQKINVRTVMPLHSRHPDLEGRETSGTDQVTHQATTNVPVNDRRRNASLENKR